MKKNITKICFKTFLILLGGILLGALLLTLAYCIPVNWNSYYSTEFTIDLQGYNPHVPNITNSYNTYFHTYLPGVLDNATVRWYMIPMTYEIGDNPLYLAMDCRGYSYYWHGYVIVLRVLQLFMNLEQVQLANDFLQIGLIVILATVIGRKKGTKYAVMLLSSYALLMPMAVAMCLQYSSVFYIAYGATLLLMLKQGWFEQGFRLYYFFLIVGMMTSYFDLLTYPLITWGIPMVWWFVMDQKKRSVTEALRKVVVLGIAWIIGYGGMWAGKWVLGTIILNKNVIEAALDEAILRTGVEGIVAFHQSNRFYAVYMNWKHYTYKLYVIILLAWLAYWLVSGLLFGWKKISPAKGLSYLLIGSSSIVWYLVLLNHTETHHAFTYRIFAISIAAFLAIVLESTSYEERRLKGIRHWVCFGFTGICLLSASIPLTLWAKEIMQADNKNYEFEAKVLEEDEFRIRFVPEYDKILAIGLGLQTNSTTGWYELSIADIADKESVIYTETIPVSHYGIENYKDYIVDWDLTAGNEYVITVNVHDMTEDVYLYYTADGFLPLGGCQYYEGDSLASNQPLLGIQYWGRLASVKDLALLGLTYFGLFWTVFYVITCIPALQKHTKRNNA